VPERPDGRHVGAHARSNDGVNLDAVFFKNLDDANVGETFRAAGGKNQAQARSRREILTQNAHLGFGVRLASNNCCFNFHFRRRGDGEPKRGYDDLKSPASS
jgi:hypothetical protein